MTGFDSVNVLTASTQNRGVGLAIDNGRGALMVHLSPDDARHIAAVLLRAADDAAPPSNGLTGEEAQAP